MMALISSLLTIVTGNASPAAFPPANPHDNSAFFPNCLSAVVISLTGLFFEYAVGEHPIKIEVLVAGRIELTKILQLPHFARVPGGDARFDRAQIDADRICPDAAKRRTRYR
jgi:hypothetical protein